MGISNSCTHAKVSLKKVPEYLTRDFGIPLLLLDAAERELCDSCGGIVGDVCIPNVPGLIAAATVYRVNLPQKLAGSEIRFIRKALQMSSKRLAELLNVSPETLSRCENDKQPLNPTAEKFLRMFAGACLSKNAPAISFDAREVSNIATMKIAAIRNSDDELVMRFGLVMVKNDRKLSEAYSEAA